MTNVYDKVAWPVPFNVWSAWLMTNFQYANMQFEGSSSDYFKNKLG